MTALLRKSKASILELMKMLPDAHIAKEEDFVAWGRQFIDIAVSRISLGGVDLTDANLAQNAYYDMSYHLGCTEDDAEVKKVVDEAQEYFNAQEKREWVEWAGKMLMPRLHAQIAMEKADAVRAEQEDLEEMQQQDEREQRERERVEKEAELDKKEEEYIR
jgi:hypothetical protein